MTRTMAAVTALLLALYAVFSLALTADTATARSSAPALEAAAAVRPVTVDAVTVDTVTVDGGPGCADQAGTTVSHCQTRRTGPVRNASTIPVPTTRLGYTTVSGDSTVTAHRPVPPGSRNLPHLQVFRC